MIRKKYPDRVPVSEWESIDVYFIALRNAIVTFVIHSILICNSLMIRSYWRRTHLTEVDLSRDENTWFPVTLPSLNSIT
jgi:hypothetical protein